MYYGESSAGPRKALCLRTACWPFSATPQHHLHQQARIEFRLVLLTILVSQIDSIRGMNRKLMELISHEQQVF